MKKILIMLLCILLLVAAFTGCGKAQKINGRIAHIYGATLLIAGEDGQLYTASAGEADTGGEKLSAGLAVEVVYGEAAAEIYPVQLGDVQKITVMGDRSNLIDVHVAIIKEILQRDIQPTEKLAYDFGETGFLTEGEQRAVGYICWTELDAEPYFGNEEELMEQEVIRADGEKMFLPDGWLLKFSRDEQDASLLRVKLWRNDEMKNEFTFILSEEEPGEWHFAKADN